MMRELRIRIAMCFVTLAAPALGAQMVASPRADTATTELAAPLGPDGSNDLAMGQLATRGPLLARQLRHSDPSLAFPTTRSTMELREESSRWSRAGKGALWGLGIYALMVGGYLLHESMTCEASCYADGWALLGIVVWTPVAVGTGAVIGFALPPRR